jgi:hypothetical protein
LAKLGVIKEEDVGGRNALEDIARRFTKASGGATERDIIDEVKKIKQETKTQEFQVKQAAIVLDEELSKLSPQDANARFQEVAKESPELAQELLEVIEERKLGLTYADRMIKTLGVENGERARFIDGQARKLKTPQERNAYVQELMRKGVVSERVYMQILELAQQ